MVGLGDGFVPVPEKRGLYRPKPKIVAQQPIGGARVA
jgi:hypothetical protein